MVETLDPHELLRIAFADRSGVYGRPLPIVSFSLNSYFGDGQFAFKATNLVIHLANAGLLFALLRLLIGVTAGTPYRTATPWRMALLVTALWTLHPLQLSSVMYVVQRMTLLATTFGLLALICYCNLRLRQVAGFRSGTNPRLCLLAVTFVLGLACKEIAVLIPVYLLVVEFVCFAPLMVDRRRWVRRYALAAGSLGAVGLIGLLITRTSVLEGYEYLNFTLAERILTQPLVVVHYLRLIALPDVDLMGIYRDGFPVSRSLGLMEMAATAALSAATIAALLLVRRAPLVALGWLLFVCSHLLESTIYPLELVFEHRNYLGLAGILLAICAVGRRVLGPFVSDAMLVLPLVALFGLTVLQTRTRAVEWSSALNHNAAAVATHPESVRAHSYLALKLADLGLVSGAVDVIDEARTVLGDHPVIVGLQLQLHAHAGSLGDELYGEALELFANERLDFNTVIALGALQAGLDAGTVTRPDANELAALYEAVISNPRRRIDPLVEPALLGRYAMLIGELGRHGEALKTAERVVHDYPERHGALLMLARVQESAGRHADAVDTLATLKKVAPIGWRTNEPQRQRLLSDAATLMESIQRRAVGESGS